MKPKLPIKKQSVELKFMDVKVKLEGSKNVEKRALRLLSSLVKDRLRVFELLDNLEHEDDEAELRPKNKKLRTDLMMYQ